MNQTDAPPAHSTRPEADERWPLVLRVAGSRHFGKAQRLDILIYLCRRAILEPGAIVKEHEIGCNVLGRKPDFSPTEDNIVRVQVSHLRKKLDEYYASDGKNDPIWIAIPKGSYVARFEPRPVSVVSESVPVSPLATPAPPVATTGRWPQVWVVILLVSAGVAVGAGNGGARQAERSQYRGGSASSGGMAAAGRAEAGITTFGGNAVAYGGGSGGTSSVRHLGVSSAPGSVFAVSQASAAAARRKAGDAFLKTLSVSAR